MLYKEEIIKIDNETMTGLNVSHLARELGMERSYVSQIKNNRRVCNTKLRNRIIEARKRMLTK